MRLTSSIQQWFSDLTQTSGTQRRKAPAATVCPQAMEQLEDRALLSVDAILVVKGAVGESTSKDPGWIEIYSYSLGANDSSTIDDLAQKVKDGGGPYLAYELENVLISSYSMSGNTSGDRPMESLSMNYTKLQLNALDDAMKLILPYIEQDHLPGRSSGETFIIVIGGHESDGAKVGSGDGATYLSYELENVLISSYSMGGNTSGDRPMESLSMNYTKLQLDALDDAMTASGLSQGDTCIIIINNHDAKGGISVAAGDVNGDGILDFMVEAEQKVYVFEGSDSATLDAVFVLAPESKSR